MCRRPAIAEMTETLSVAGLEKLQPRATTLVGTVSTRGETLRAAKTVSDVIEQSISCRFMLKKAGVMSMPCTVMFWIPQIESIAEVELTSIVVDMIVVSKDAPGTVAPIRNMFSDKRNPPAYVPGATKIQTGASRGTGSVGPFLI